MDYFQTKLKNQADFSAVFLMTVIWHILLSLLCSFVMNYKNRLMVNKIFYILLTFLYQR